MIIALCLRSNYNEFAGDLDGHEGVRRLQQCVRSWWTTPRNGREEIDKKKTLIIYLKKKLITEKTVVVVAISWSGMHDEAETARRDIYYSNNVYDGIGNIIT